MGWILALAFLVSQVRFAWLTDLHVGGATGLGDLRAAVADIRTQPDIGFVLITGDITESGLTADLIATRQVLDSLAVPWHIIPGNHDTKWSESGTTAFRTVFGPDRFIADLPGFILAGFHQGPRMRMADGHVAPEDLQWLDSVVAGSRHRQLPLLVATHYPLDSGVTNWYEVTERLHATDTRIVFCGHGHRNRVEEFEGHRGLMGRSNLRGRGEHAGYNLVTIRNDSIIVAERTTDGRTGAAWYTAQLTRGDRPAPGSVPRPSMDINRAYPSVRVRWSFSAGSSIVAGAAVAESTVIAVDMQGRIHALRLGDGSRLWSHATGGPVVATPAVSDDGVIVASADSTIRKVSVRSGALQWLVRAGAPVVAAPAVDRDTVYVGGSDGVFRALEARTGRTAWATPGIGGFVEARPAVDRHRVIVGAWDERVYAFDRATGAVLWTWQGGRPGPLHSPAACWPVVQGDRVHIVAPDRFMTSIDARTGATVWRSAAHVVRESIGGDEEGRHVFVRTMRDSIIAIDALGREPRTVWVRHAGFGYDINAAMPRACGGRVFFGTMKGVVLALDAATGEILWQHRIGPTAVNTVAPLDAHTVVCTDFDGRVVCLEETP